MATGLLIAAHGSDAEPDVNEFIGRRTMQIAGHGLFDEVRCAFHQGRPGFAEAVDAMAADAIVIVPLMTSQGYYADRILPKAVTRARRFAHVTIHQTSVVGQHAGIADLVRRRCSDLVARFGLDASDTSLVLVGHGTRKHSESRDSTLACVDALKLSGVAADVLPAFLDDEPSIESVASTLTRRDAVVIPFLIGSGVHASVDIKRRFGGTASPATELVVLKETGGRRIAFDLPIGQHRDIMSAVVDLATEGLSCLRKALA